MRCIWVLNFLVQSDISNPHNCWDLWNARGDACLRDFLHLRSFWEVSPVWKHNDLWFLFQMANDSTETSEAGEEEEEQRETMTTKSECPSFSEPDSSRTIMNLSWAPCHFETYVCVRSVVCVHLCQFWTMQSKILQNTKCVVKCSTEVPFLVRCWNVAMF